MVLACAEASRPKHCTGFARIDRLGSVQADHADLERLAVGVHVDGVAVDDLDHRVRSLNPLRHSRIRLGGAGQDKPGQHHHDRDDQVFHGFDRLNSTLAALDDEPRMSDNRIASGGIPIHKWNASSKGIVRPGWITSVP